MNKDHNEITVMFNTGAGCAGILAPENKLPVVNADMLKEQLMAKGFKPGRAFSINDTYYLPKWYDKNRPTLLVLNDAVIIRDFGERKCLTYKCKEYDEDWNILSQSKTDLDIEDAARGAAFLESIGYKPVMTIRDDCLVMSRDGLELVIESVEGGRLLFIELEENERYQGIDTLIGKLEETGLEYDRSTYFAKKAQIIYEELYCDRL